MIHPPFCTNPDCPLHNPEEVKKRRKKKSPTFHKNGTRSTQAFGKVPCFRCVLCRTNCSSQSFSLDYYAKKVLTGVLSKLKEKSEGFIPFCKEHPLSEVF